MSITDQHLRKPIGRTIMHSDFFPPVLPLVIGEHGSPCPQLSLVDGALLGSVEQKTKLFTENTAASEVAPSLRVQNT